VIAGVSVRVLGESLSAAADSSLLISSLFFSIGALLGFCNLNSGSRKGRVIKSAIPTLMIIMSIFILKSGEYSDEELIKTRWETQQIGSIEFETVDQLKRTSSSVPLHLNAVYEKLDLYLDDVRENDRMSCFMDATLVTDTVSINDAFTVILDGMLLKRISPLKT
jgi:hypothetical protein